jgi:hypothetical protein
MVESPLYQEIVEEAARSVETRARKYDRFGVLARDPAETSDPDRFLSPNG